MMKKIIKESYLFLILFIIILLKDALFSLIDIKLNNCNTDKYKILLNEYNNLLKFNGIPYEYSTDYLNTIIINKDIYNYMNEIIIRGGKDINLNNNAVIYNNTLLGVVTKVNKKTSNVRLLTNKNSKISVKINDEVGMLEYDGNNVVVNNISNYSDISIGDNIYTSGLGNIKENIFIGKVKSIKLNSKNIEKSILVNYDLDIKNINYVTIIRELI